jgi:hypothetical protein
MQIVIVSFPEMLVSLEEAKLALGESGSDRDELIEGLILAAQAELDGPKGWVGVSVAQQGVEVTFDSFDCPPIRLPGGPIIGDVAVTYLDADGASHVLDVADYEVLPDGSLSLVAGGAWPALADQAGAIKAAYTAGMVEGEEPQRIALMKTAIKLHTRMTLDGVEPEKSRRAIESLVRSLWVPVL